MKTQKPEVETIPSAEDKSANPSEATNTAQTLPQGSSGLRLRRTAQGMISDF